MCVETYEGGARWDDKCRSYKISIPKYWLSVDAKEQARRFRDRIENPSKRWKISEMDLESRKRWVDYSRAKDDMFKYTDIKQAP